MNCIVCQKRAYSDYCVQHKPRKPIKTNKPLPRPSKPIKQIGKKGRANQATTKAWRESIKDDTDWMCYLKISPLCPRLLTMETVTPEHVIPKSRGQKYAHDLTNIKKACVFCNSMKGSRVL